MKPCYYDLHIHSCLSPCASDDMTPCNIAGMASLKGLSLIALTDHNTCRNIPAMAEAAKSLGITLVPGIEITTLEEVHVLAYFKASDAAFEFGEMIYASLPDIANRPDIFGRQIVMSPEDERSGELSKLLMQACPYSIDEVVHLALEYGGCTVPAHINRSSFSVFSNLGFLPPGLFHAVEIFSPSPCPDIDASILHFYSSDAHDLGDIAEPSHALSNIHSAADLVDFINQTAHK